jgi:aquaporin Z
MDRNLRIGLAEAVGTAILMLGGPGSAIIAADAIGVLGVSLAFGFSLLVAAYVVGPVSGCHINPAVTVGLAVAKKTAWKDVPYYVVGQLVGAAAGGLALFAITSGGDKDATDVFASNGWGEKIGSNFGLGAVVIVEIIFTALLVFAVLGTTRKGFPAAAGGITAGMVLALIHLVTIPVDNTSVNPARSFGAAIFGGGDHIAQLWAFIVFPLIGGVVGALLWSLLDDKASGAAE